MSNSTVPEAAFRLLSIEAVLFSSITGLSGAYLVLFVLALWATYRRASEANARLRIITWVLFVDICIHYTMRAVSFAKVRTPTLEDYDMLVWCIPVSTVAFFTSVTAGLISDSLLAWRLHVLWGCARWTLWVSTTAVAATAMVGFASAFQNLAFYRSAAAYVAHLEAATFAVNVAWAWLMLGTNTLLTGAVVGRIAYLARAAPARRTGGVPCATVVEASVESALVTWVGLVFYGVATVAPEGRVTTNLDIGFVLGCIIPLFFGISQCLITVRLGLAHEDAESAGQHKLDSGAGSPENVVVDIQRAVAGQRCSRQKFVGIEKEGGPPGLKESDSERSSVEAAV
ncbi:hypothetical protein PsYK624_024480 [Phanerochaete sordida]|uniref:Uncharacterized protein n=1 Tax=Phanerochaete sordida TaxID=48140 RepID=A0A9P3L9V8_9APHY|nr:hypothetical protein PsYK624_024480 [Phanerochaete sordida]